MERKKLLREYFRGLGAVCRESPDSCYPDLTEGPDKISPLSAVKDEMYYEKLVNGAVPARTGFEKAI